VLWKLLVVGGGVVGIRQGMLVLSLGKAHQDRRLAKPLRMKAVGGRPLQGQPGVPRRVGLVEVGATVERIWREYRLVPTMPAEWTTAYQVIASYDLDGDHVRRILTGQLDALARAPM
jgi:hypothetical protein